MLYLLKLARVGVLSAPGLLGVGIGTVIDENTHVSLGSAWAVITTIVITAWILSGKFQKIEGRLTAIERKISGK